MIPFYRFAPSALQRKTLQCRDAKKSTLRMAAIGVSRLQNRVWTAVGVSVSEALLEPRGIGPRVSMA